MRIFTTLFMSCFRPALLILAGAATALAQPDRGVLLTVDTRNYVIYWEDIADPAKFATSSTAVPAQRARNFDRGLGIGDIVSINGSPVKGTFNYQTSIFAMNSVATPGQALVDSLSRGANLTFSYDIQGPDGTQIGTIWAAGFAGAVPPPGAPVAGGQNITIIGGTGAFLGARGQITGMPGVPAIPSRTASMMEDPANRHVHGGGNRRDVIHLIPAERPEILSVFHADFSPVTAAKPAHGGELLIAAAKGLGPVRAVLPPGAVFPSSPLAVANSPIEVLAGGAKSEVLYAGGVPETADKYQVNFRLPAGIAPGNVTLQPVTAFIPGPMFTIPVAQ
jgi:hypothetical protein